ncbi:hypothetical protein B0T18DRAFT_335358, partial [Schizothecium vesticola]
IQEYCRTAYNWVNPRTRGRNAKPVQDLEEPWDKGVLCQRFFKSRLASSWFQVLPTQLAGLPGQQTTLLARPTRED